MDIGFTIFLVVSGVEILIILILGIIEAVTKQNTLLDAKPKPPKKKQALYHSDLHVASTCHTCKFNKICSRSGKYGGLKNAR